MASSWPGLARLCPRRSNMPRPVLIASGGGCVYGRWAQPPSCHAHTKMLCSASTVFASGDFGRAWSELMGESEERLESCPSVQPQASRTAVSKDPKSASRGHRPITAVEPQSSWSPGRLHHHPAGMQQPHPPHASNNKAGRDHCSCR